MRNDTSESDIERARDQYRWAVRDYSEALRIDDAETVKRCSERLERAKKELAEAEGQLRDRDWQR